VAQPCHLIDIMATCVDIGGANYPRQFDGHEITPLEGSSLLPLLTGSPPAAMSDRLLFWEHEGNAAVRWNDWKLVRVSRTGPWELYDMKTDRTELHDLSAINPKIVTDLTAKWEEWARRTYVTPAPTGGKGRVAAQGKD
jgi:arylsulfatase A-like enzyme